ncbi:PAS domain-containing protein [Desulfosarcina ovata]|uniref:histidine kinase n=2 Tax=Desulfosarcina ovata TaxID=83564 RepID=A0A5K8AJN7_9BACT|nr:PAS domain-containing protein [Desulfosarcina ovata]BBO85929.1 hypothetical protein DSCO28_64950 [Desulfosarcina ovata subsp. sediminis]BBO92917.1 hypothetical protein DSCOOX_60970 [Desulfosarcina ovata subsp. ovata]
MTVTTLWVVIVLISVLGGVGLYFYRRQYQQIDLLRRELLEIQQKLHGRDAAHSLDRSQWEQTEEKLRKYLELMDTLINTIPNPIYFKDAAGIYQGCNKVFAKTILGLTRDLIIGRHPQELTEQIPADLAAAYQREERRMIDKAGFHSFETKVQCADGQRRDFLFSMAPVMDPDGSHSGTVVVLADLTEKNRAARDRIQKEKLEGVLEIAGAVCHELNQPLQTLSGYVEMLTMSLDGHAAGAYLEKITPQIERMHDISNKLRRITRYETMDYGERTKIIDICKASEDR